MKTELVNIAKSFAAEYSSNAVYPAHLFKAVLHKDAGLVHFLEIDLDKDYYYLQEWADVQISLAPRATRPSTDLPLSDESNRGFSYLRLMPVLMPGAITMGALPK